MSIDEIVSILDREPFVPLRVVRSDGKSFTIAFAHAARLSIGGLMVFRGVKDAIHQRATGFDVIGYDRITAIEPKKPARSKRPPKRKAG